MLAYSLGIYHALKFVHILAAVVWVGGGLFVQIYATKLRRANDPDRLAAFARDIGFFGTRVFSPAAGIALLMGISMVIYSPAVFWSETWIIIGLVGFAATFVTGTFFLGPESSRIVKAYDAEGAESPVVQASIRRIFAISRIDQVVLVLVLVDMVFKPGAKALF